MIILHLALGGCLKSPPVNYGITADTGGHIAYVLEAASHQARLDDVTEVLIVTRYFNDPRFDPVHGTTHESMGPKISIHRIATYRSAYCEKEDLEAETASFTAGLIEYLARLPNLPDIIHAHFADAAAVAIAVQKRFGIAFIFTPHALGVDKQLQGLSCPGLDRRIEAEGTAIAAAGALIVSTRDEGERQVGAYGQTMGQRVHVVAPGVPRRDLPVSKGHAEALLAEWFDRPHLPIILAVSRPVRKKNLAALLAAYAGDPALQASANLVILAGQHVHAAGEERDNLDDLLRVAARHGLDGRVAIPPAHDAQDVAALYAYAAQGGVFVNPALHEPFGLTLIEAAAAGTPVVATKNGGPREIVAEIGHGELVCPRDEDAIAAAIGGIILHPERQAALSDAARTGAGRYCWDRYARRSIDIYRSVTRPRLLACDIDNTLTGCLEAAADFAVWHRQSAFPFLVATGRDFDAARTILRRWGLPEPDAFIVDVGTRLMLPDGQGGWQECREFSRYLNGGWNREGVVEALRALKLQPQPRATEGPYKISFFGNEADAARIRDALDDHGLSANIVFSHGRLIDVLAPRGGKAEAIAAYARRSGLSLSHCIAAGDSGNDADMLSACGHAIVVGNATEELDGLAERNGSMRVTLPYAAGVLEGLTLLGLYDSETDVVAAAA